VVYRAGFARTRRHARQLVNHGHFLVNGHKVNIPSYQVSQHDVIDVRPKSLEMTPFIIARETHGERVVPAWMEVMPNRMRILIHQLPVRQQIDVPVQEQLIVEYYSKMSACGGRGLRTSRHRSWPVVDHNRIPEHPVVCDRHIAGGAERNSKCSSPSVLP
jgi:hypothetical protein